ncbi:Cytochrome c-type biogenesis protein CcmG/DsbE, thiol:disulfide oxidoreductase [hydrothermal vent metagenome]|uniref:Cytochrome c-type biogenesis protein CcmG/DsbE, thiol:disulfide oxidoreductase n=1 Tax=hydrothermal vent metagenome TaxID=652676 RepID=A0A3B0YJF6_9ZZZZ
MPAFVRYLTPLLAFIALAALLYKGLALDPRRLPSPLIDKPAPAFSLPLLQHPQTLISTADFKGQVTLFNVWATWCVACRHEHPLLMQLAKQGVRIYGLNYKDKREDAKRWLQLYGDPYLANAFDAEGRVGINWGVYGTPETFVVDKQGTIRHKHIGPLTPASISTEILPLVRKLQEENT